MHWKHDRFWVIFKSMSIEALIKMKSLILGVPLSLPWARPGALPTSAAPKPPAKGPYKKLDL